MNYIPNEVIIFLESCVIGVAFGAFYDIFRIIRLTFKNPSVLILFEDLLYFIVLTLVSFTFIVVRNEGYLRSFLLIGELLGLIFYFYAISNPITSFIREKMKIIVSKFKIRLK